MFEEHRAHRAQKQYDEDRAAWESHVAEYRTLVDLASTFSGDTTSQLILEQGETVFFTVEDAELVEERRGPGSWHGRSQGVSIPIGSIGGRSVRYRVGASKGHFVQGEEQPTVIDRGTLYITSSRVVFQGGKQTRQCDLGKLVAVHHDPSGGILTMSVSNRQTPMVIRCGSSLSEALKFRLDLAIAHHNRTMPAFVDALRSDLNALEADPPHPPSTAVPPVQWAPAVQPLSPAMPLHPAPAMSPMSASSPMPASSPMSASSPGLPDSSVLPPGNPATTRPAMASAPPQLDNSQQDTGPAVAAAAPVPTTPSGWYPDPWGLASLRWWDGATWSGDVSGPGAR